MRADFGSHFFYAYTHKVKYRPRKERDKYPNLVYSTWDTVDLPRQVIVSDMTMIKGPFFLFEVTFYFDVFIKEMLTFQVGLRRGDRTQYIEGLVDIIKILRFQGYRILFFVSKIAFYVYI